MLNRAREITYEYERLLPGESLNSQKRAPILEFSDIFNPLFFMLAQSFSMLIMGRPRSGKTRVLFLFLEVLLLSPNFREYDTVYIVTNSRMQYRATLTKLKLAYRKKFGSELNACLYGTKLQKDPNNKKEKGKNGIEAVMDKRDAYVNSRGPDEYPYSALLIIDDAMNLLQQKRVQDTLVDLMSRLNGLRLSMFVLNQNFFKTPTSLRRGATVTITTGFDINDTTMKTALTSHYGKYSEDVLEHSEALIKKGVMVLRTGEWGIEEDRLRGNPVNKVPYSSDDLDWLSSTHVCYVYKPETVTSFKSKALNAPIKNTQRPEWPPRGMFAPEEDEEEYEEEKEGYGNEYSEEENELSPIYFVASMTKRKKKESLL